MSGARNETDHQPANMSPSQLLKPNVKMRKMPALLKDQAYGGDTTNMASKAPAQELLAAK
jgi:hypothetical protein